jgi:hypothetical protein
LVFQKIAVFPKASQKLLEKQAIYMKQAEALPPPVPVALILTPSAE